MENERERERERERMCACVLIRLDVGMLEYNRKKASGVGTYMKGRE